MPQFDLSSFSLKKLKGQPANKKKMIIAGAVIVILVIIGLIQVLDYLSFVFSGKKEIAALKADIKKLQNKLQISQEEYSQIKTLENGLIEKKGDFWLPDKDGNMNAVIQNKIQSVASECSVELRSTGTIQINNVAEGISTAQFDIACAGDMKSIANFIYKLTTSHPKMFWDRCSLRSDDIRNFSKLYFSASLTFISLENKQLQDLFNSATTEGQEADETPDKTITRREWRK